MPAAGRASRAQRNRAPARPRAGRWHAPRRLGAAQDRACRAFHTHQASAIRVQRPIRSTPASGFDLSGNNPRGPRHDAPRACRPAHAPAPAAIGFPPESPGIRRGQRGIRPASRGFRHRFSAFADRCPDKATAQRPICGTVRVARCRAGCAMVRRKVTRTRAALVRRRERAISAASRRVPERQPAPRLGSRGKSARRRATGADRGPFRRSPGLTGDRAPPARARPRTHQGRLTLSDRGQGAFGERRGGT